MKEKSKTRSKLLKYTPFVLYAVYNLFLHMKGYVCESDDVFVRGYQMSSSVAEELQNVIREYKSWSSRFLINLVTRLLCHMNEKIWMVLDVSVLLLIFLGIDFLINPRKLNRRRWILLGCMMIFPFYLSIGTGWVVGTSAYILPALFGVVACISIRFYFEQKTMRWFVAVPLFMSTFVAANKEEMAVLLTVIFFSLFAYSWYRSKISVCFLVQLIISAGSVFYHLTCSGNQVRVSWGENGAEHISFADKVDNGIWSTLTHPILYSHYVLICVTLVTGLYVCFVHRKKIMPVLMLGVLTFGALFSWIHSKNGFMHRLYGNILFISDGKYTYLDIVVVTALALAFWMMFIASVLMVFEKESTRYLVLTVLFGALCSHIPAGFGGVDVRYYDRSYTCMYFCASVLLAVVFDKLLEKNNGRLKQRLAEFFFVLVAVGVTYNLFGCDIV